MSWQQSSQGSARQGFKWSLSPEAADATASSGQGLCRAGREDPTPLPQPAICMGGGALLPPPVACLGQRALRGEGQAAAPGPCAGHRPPVRLGSRACMHVASLLDEAGAPAPDPICGGCTGPLWG